MLNTLNGSHKRRLYIAYYVRPTLSPGDPHRYHSGLLTFRTAKSDATVFHATTSPGSPWQFEAKVIAPRTMRLVCLLYIGKLDHAITDDVLVDLLGNNVPVNNVNPNWNCLDWVYDSLRVRIHTRLHFTYFMLTFYLFFLGFGGDGGDNGTTIKFSF